MIDEAILSALDPGPAEPERPRMQPTTGRAGNALRPEGFDQIIGQARAKRLMRLVIDASLRRGQPLDHVLLTGPAGTGKTTFATVVANELGVDCYEVAAPVSLDVLLDLREVMQDSDVLFIDEIHMQAIGERRGKESISAPEVFLTLLEDRRIATSEGMLDYPHITVIGATTDPGQLPDPFVARFPLQPRLERYTEADMRHMARMNADRLGLTVTKAAFGRFARASRGVPRNMNNLMKNAALLADARDRVTVETAKSVIHELNDLTEDGLTRHMQDLLTFLYTRCRRESRGEVRFQASIGSIATALGLSRDVKAVQLRVEPELIQRGYVQVAHGGRVLTDAGVERAKELL